MPELPEVESVVRQLAKKLVSKKIKAVDLFISLRRSNLILQNKNDLLDEEITSVTRKGKYILIELAQAETLLIIHLGMAGYLIFEKDFFKQTRHKVIEFTFYETEESLSFFDIRRFGQLFLILKKEVNIFFKNLAPDPFEHFWSNDLFFEELKKSSIPIKIKILEQSFISGIGNIYASESLFESKINPITPCNKVSKQQAAILLTKIKEVLQRSIDLGGSSIRDFKHTNDENGSAQLALAVYGKKDLPCKICKTKIQKIVQAGRSTFFCSTCQT